MPGLLGSAILLHTGYSQLCLCSSCVHFACSGQNTFQCRIVERETVCGQGAFKSQPSTQDRAELEWKLALAWATQKDVKWDVKRRDGVESNHGILLMCFLQFSFLLFFFQILSCSFPFKRACQNQKVFSVSLGHLQKNKCVIAHQNEWQGIKMYLTTQNKSLNHKGRCKNRKKRQRSQIKKKKKKALLTAGEIPSLVEASFFKKEKEK